MIEITDIKASIQSKALIQADFFKDAEFLKDSRGRFISYTGGYTIVIPCMVNSEKWAFRCWHVPVGDSKKRYSLISETIKNIDLPYFCSFEHIERGLIVKGESLSITKMKWIEGDNLKNYICRHYSDKSRIIKLATDFFEMINVLHRFKIAHGDLQHGNILVSESGKLFLVDYDSMYVPSMGRNTFNDNISGLVDYQHPARKKNIFSSEKLDYFSELIIYTSLLGIAENPQFVQSYKVEDTEGLLFTASDFVSLHNSKVYKDLHNLENSEINNCLDILQEYLSIDDINKLQPFESYLISIEISAPEYIIFGESCEIKWSSNGAKTIEIEGIGRVNLSGNVRISPKATTNYTFILTSTSGKEEKKTIKIEVYRHGKINSFRAERAFTFSTIPVSISWDCIDMIELEIVGYGLQQNKGTIEVVIDKNTTFELRAKDHFREFRHFLTVGVLPTPSIKSISVPKFEAEYNSNITINPSRILVKSLGPKLSINQHVKFYNYSFHPHMGNIIIKQPKVYISKSLIKFTDKICELISDLLANVNSNFFKLSKHISSINK